MILKVSLAYAIINRKKIKYTSARALESLKFEGSYDQVEKAKENYPSYWDLGKIYMRLIRDIGKGDLIQSLIEVYNSWIVDSIENYNSAFYYMSPGYIVTCYSEGEILEY